MSEHENVQRIGAYAWCLILAVVGGALVIGSLGGAPGEEPATVIAEKDTPSPVLAEESNGAFYSEGDRPGITRVSEAE
ncbi:MAG TPA: hypothetical protein VMO81_00940 [Aestuariivirgaceae bacterium]|nr:hypothetical protein [Aestuariivirgaceae bacterium]